MKFYKRMDITMGRLKPTYVQHNPNNPASLYMPHISSTYSSLKELTLSDLLNPEDLDIFISFKAPSVGG
jgi:hypothetical protein